MKLDQSFSKLIGSKNQILDTNKKNNLSGVDLRLYANF